MKMKQLGANMRGQVTIALDFMFSFKPTKLDNMVILLLDLQFKDLSLMVNYLAILLQLKLLLHMTKSFSFLP
jgi:hypothetical protein